MATSFADKAELLFTLEKSLFWSQRGHPLVAGRASFSSQRALPFGTKGAALAAGGASFRNERGPL